MAKAGLKKRKLENQSLLTRLIILHSLATAVTLWSLYNSYRQELVLLSLNSLVLGGLRGDRTQQGLTQFMFDVYYVVWFVNVTGYFSRWFNWLLLAIPLLIAYHIKTFFTPK